MLFRKKTKERREINLIYVEYLKLEKERWNIVFLLLMINSDLFNNNNNNKRETLEDQFI